MNKRCLQHHRISTLFCTYHQSWSRQEWTVQLHTTNCDDWIILALCLTPYRLSQLYICTMCNSIYQTCILYLRPFYNLLSISDQCRLSLRRGNPTCLNIFHQPRNHCHRTSKLPCSCLHLTCTSNTDLRTHLPKLPRKIHPFLRKYLGLGASTNIMVEFLRWWTRSS